MTRDELFGSNYVNQADVRTPVVVTIETLTSDYVQDGAIKKKKAIMSFAADQLKPLIVNRTNWLILESLYGPNSDAWHGRQIELYVDPTVTNPRNPSHPGGIRVRIPAAPPRPARPAPMPPAVPQYGSSPRPAPSQQRVTPPAARPTPAAPRPTPLADKLKQAREGFERADTAERADAWWAWADKLAFDDQARTELTHLYHAALQRIAMEDDPAAAGVGANEDGIPF